MSSTQRASSQEPSNDLAPPLSLKPWTDSPNSRHGSDTTNRDTSTSITVAAEEEEAAVSSSSAIGPLSKGDAGANSKSAETQCRPANVMAPSVQFNEQSLHGPTSAHRNRANAALSSSPTPGTSLLTESPSTGPKASLQPRREANASQQRAAGPSIMRESHSLQKLSSRTSAAGSSINQTGSGRSVVGTRRGRANPTIVTVPVWARDESPSPPHSPSGSSRAHSVSRSLHDAGLSMLPAADVRSEDRSEADPSKKPRSRSPEGMLTPEKPGAPLDRAMSPEAIEQAEAQESQSTSPDRWWTFTLPQKYRTRLHEHHLRMASHHDRMRSNALDANASNKANKQNRRRSQGGKKLHHRLQRSSSESSRSYASSSAENNDMATQESRRRDRNEQQDGYGFGAGTWRDMAAGLGASGLLNNKLFGTPQPVNTASRLEHGDGDGDDSAALREQPRQSSSSPGGTSTTRADDRDLEKQHRQDEEPEYPTLSFKARIEHPEVFTVHQPATPGWASPWKPEERGHGDLGAAGYFPRTESGRTYASMSGRGKGWYEAWKTFLIHNPFVPLLFRLINIAFTSATLAVAIKLLIILRSEGASDSVGASPLVAIIYAPLTLVHVCFQIWLEYFGRPIGLWTVQSKLSYSVVELIFICLWSSELSLTFDNYFTSTLVCVDFGSPFVGPHQPPSDRPSPLKNPGRKPYICRLQGSLIGLVFVSLLAYLIVLTVSLFRIFVRVTGGGRR